MSAVSFADMMEGLFRDFETRFPLPVIEEVVAAARRDLAGHCQAPDGQLELIFRLARQRLSEQLETAGR